MPYAKQWFSTALIWLVMMSFPVKKWSKLTSGIGNSNLFPIGNPWFAKRQDADSFIGSAHYFLHFSGKSSMIDIGLIR